MKNTNELAENVKAEAALVEAAADARDKAWAEAEAEAKAVKTKASEAEKN